MHKHHLIPKHSGGSDSDYNLTPPIPVACHALFHWREWVRTGNELDKISWKALSGQITSDEARVMATRESNLKRVRDGTHPFLLSNRNWDISAAARKAALTQLEKGNLSLLKFNQSPEHALAVSNNQKQRVAEGTHHFLKGNETWDRSAVSKELAKRMVEEGRCALLSENRYWDIYEVAKRARESMSPEREEELVRKQTVNRRINSGWTPEKIAYIGNNLGRSSSKLLTECQELFNWPNSRGVIQNIVFALKKEGIENIFSYDFRPSKSY
jgi:hypothetical protein